jgi:MoxR-like ATPase
MKKVIEVQVTREGRFFKAYTENGTDWSSTIDRKLRQEALDSGTSLRSYDGGVTWEFATNVFVPNPAVEVEPTAPAKPTLMQEIGRYSIPSDLYISDLKWKYLVRSVLRGANIMMVGSSGAGKTKTAHCVAEALQRPYFYFSLGSTQDPRASLIGNTHFKSDSGTFFSESRFVTAIQTENAIILLDEISRAHPEAWNILMPVLDPNQRYLSLDEKDGSPIVRVAKGVSFIATANIGTEYTSTRRMDRALRDRFTSTIEMELLSPEDETRLLMSRVEGLKESQAKTVCDIADTIRKDIASESPRLTTTLSTRSTLEVAQLLADGFSLADAGEVAIYPHFDAAGGNESERTFVRQIVQKYGEI